MFSLGSYIQSSFMPKHQVQMFLNVFGNLSQTILWKYEADDLDRIPANVKLQSWIPQSDVLGHENVVLFITHGGMFGSQEGLARGKPMLFIPFYGDQVRISSVKRQFSYWKNFSFSTGMH